MERKKIADIYKASHSSVFLGGLGLIYTCSCGTIPYLCNRRLFSTLNVSITNNLLWPVFTVLYRASKTRHYNSIDDSLNPPTARSMCWFFKAEAKLSSQHTNLVRSGSSLLSLLSITTIGQPLGYQHFCRVQSKPFPQEKFTNKFPKNFTQL